MGKPRTFETIVISDEQGNPRTYNRELMLDFFRENPGERFTMNLKKVGKRETDKIRAYYFSELVPKFMVALRGYGYRFNKAQTHDFIKQFSPTMNETIEIDGHYFTRERGFSDDDFDASDAWDAIDELKQAGAEIFGIIINDPDPAWRERKAEEEEQQASEADTGRNSHDHDISGKSPPATNEAGLIDKNAKNND